MKLKEIIPCLNQFFIDNANRNQFHTNDLKDWLLKWNFSIPLNRNQLYEALNLLKGFLVYERNEIYSFDMKKVDTFFKKYPDNAKEFYKLRKGV